MQVYQRTPAILLALYSCYICALMFGFILIPCICYLLLLVKSSQTRCLVLTVIFEWHFLQEFNKKSNSLYTILRSSRLAGSQRAPFLRRFLLRLNFNSYFEAMMDPSLSSLLISGFTSSSEFLTNLSIFSLFFPISIWTGNCKRCSECCQTSPDDSCFATPVASGLYYCKFYMPCGDLCIYLWTIWIKRKKNCCF